VTKLHTAAATLRLVELGDLQLQDPIGPHLSAACSHLLRAGGHDPDCITVSHLLCHTSGLPDHAALPSYAEAVLASPRRRWTRFDQVGMALTAPPSSQAPGLLCQYSDTGYVLLGEVIERVTGKNLGAAFRELLVFERLGLRQTWWEDDEPQPAGTRPKARQWLGPVDVTEFDPSFDRFGGGGLVSTVHDLALFARALFRGQVLARPSSLVAACLVPPSERAAGTRVHSHLAMVLPMGQSWGWGHLGFWGCGVAHDPMLDITVAATINQPFPKDPSWRTDLIRRLSEPVVDAMLSRNTRH
jgi:D-alanyl-D-alanine carboxypeptidase